MPLFLVAQRLARRFNRFHALELLLGAVAIVFLGAAAFAIAEGDSYGTALYWAVTTATTVGYGDVLPHDTAGRIIAMLVMLSTIPLVGAVFAMVAGASALNHVRRLLGMTVSLPDKPHILVLGTHPVLPRALVELGRSGDPVVLVAPTGPRDLPGDIRLLAGDPMDENVLRRSHPERACRALIACASDADTLVVAVGVHSLAPSLEVYALTQSPRVARALIELGVTHTLATDELVGHTLAKSLETPQAGDLLLQLVDSGSYRLSETPVAPNLVSQPLSRARGEAGRLVLGISRGDHVDLGVGGDPVLGADDRLIVLQALDAA